MIWCEITVRRNPESPGSERRSDEKKNGITDVSGPNVIGKDRPTVTWVDVVKSKKKG